VEPRGQWSRPISISLPAWLDFTTSFSGKGKGADFLPLADAEKSFTNHFSKQSASYR
jgi:hypothetical protein